jgi:hypothetical protein
MFLIGRSLNRALIILIHLIAVAKRGSNARFLANGRHLIGIAQGVLAKQGLKLDF